MIAPMKVAPRSHPVKFRPVNNSRPENNSDQSDTPIGSATPDDTTRRFIRMAPDPIPSAVDNAAVPGLDTGDVLVRCERKHHPEVQPGGVDVPYRVAGTVGIQVQPPGKANRVRVQEPAQRRIVVAVPQQLHPARTVTLVSVPARELRGGRIGTERSR